MAFISVFDVLGPNMIGPSSSHTAGAEIIAFLAQKMIAPPLKRADFTLYGSFAKTYHGHGTDRALLGGIMGFSADDTRIRDSFAIATDRGLGYSFTPNEAETDIHPNTVDIRMENAAGQVMTVRGESLGGGKVRIVRYEAGGYGKYIVIRHNNGLETIYGHLSKQLVEENQEVRSGEVIGLGGNTGRSTGSHLHFETRLCGVALNPALMFDFRAQDVTGDYYAFNKETYDNESTNATRLRGKQDSSTYASTNSSDDYATNKRTTSGLTDQISYHKVKKGETLDRIAKKRGVTVEKICKLNHITKTMRLRPGQILRYS